MFVYNPFEKLASSPQISPKKSADLGFSKATIYFNVKKIGGGNKGDDISDL